MTLNTYSNCQKYPVDNKYLPQKPIFYLLRSTTTHLRDTRLLKFGNAQNDLKLTLNT